MTRIKNGKIIFAMTMKSVKSINPCKSVIQTSIDIISKGHDGHLKVETEEGLGTRFIVRLPVV